MQRGGLWDCHVGKYCIVLGVLGKLVLPPATLGRRSTRFECACFLVFLLLFFLVIKPLFRNAVPFPTESNSHVESSQVHLSVSYYFIFFILFYFKKNMSRVKLPLILGILTLTGLFGFLKAFLL